MERRNFIYYIILTVLVIVILAVGVLILRKRAMVGLSSGSVERASVVETIPGTDSLKTVPVEGAWKPGDGTASVDMSPANWPGGQPATSSE
jgi:hypothetical protein